MSKFRKFRDPFDLVHTTCPGALWGMKKRMIGEHYYKLPSVRWLRGHKAVRYHLAISLCRDSEDVEFLFQNTVLMDWIDIDVLVEDLTRLGVDLDELEMAVRPENKRWVLVAKVMLRGDRDAFGRLKSLEDGKFLRDSTYRALNKTSR